LRTIPGNSPVPDFVWSNSLLRDALSWAKHLAATRSFSHSSNFKQNGENLYKGSGTPSCKSAVDAFFNEYKYYDQQYKIGEGPFSQYGHYTQVNNK
jgi:hypothetical protein